MSNKFHGEVVFCFVKIFLKRQNHIHFVHIAFDGFDAVFFPSPNLRRNIIMSRNSFLFCPSGNSHIKSWIVDENNDIRIEFLNIFLTNFYRSEEHTSELQSRENLVCRLLLEETKDCRLPTRTR